MRPAHPIIQTLTDVYRQGRPLVLLFDYDGTLTPLVESPRLARMAPSTRLALAELAELPRVFVGVVSGRGLDDLREMVDLTGLYYAGCGGAELDLLGVKRLPPNAEEGLSLLRQITPRLQQALRAYPDAWIEDKPLGRAIHYRQVPEDERPALRRAVKRSLNGKSELVNFLDVALALEITPKLGCTKGTAVRQIVEDAAREAFPFYAGDETNDREAIEAATELGGIAVGVGPNAPPATFTIESSTDFTALLRRLPVALQGAIERRA